MTELDDARDAWNAACCRAEEAGAALRTAGNPRVGPVYEAWKAACVESRRTSDIWYRLWERWGRPTATIDKR